MRKQMGEKMIETVVCGILCPLYLRCFRFIMPRNHRLISMFFYNETGLCIFNLIGECQ